MTNLDHPLSFPGGLGDGLTRCIPESVPQFKYGVGFIKSALKGLGHDVVFTGIQIAHGVHDDEKISSNVMRSA